MPRFTDSEQRVQRLTNAAERAFRREFMDMVAAARSELSVSALQGLISQGRFGLAFEELEAMVEQFSRSWGIRFNIAASNTATVIRREFGRNFAISQTADTVLRKIRDNQARIVTEFLRQQRVVARAALVDAVGRGLEASQAAQNFRDAIGLTRQDARAIANYRRVLESDNPGAALSRTLRDRRFDSAVLRGSLSSSQIDKMVDRYRERRLQARAAVIGRTEGRRAVNQGMEEAFEQAALAGVIQGSSVTRTWITAEDEKVRGTHVFMHGQVRGANEPFISGGGAILMYPGDSNAPPVEVINCRCLLLHNVGVPASVSPNINRE